MDTKYTTDHTPHNHTIHNSTQIKNKKLSVTGLILGSISGVLSLAVAIYYASYEHFGIVPPHLEGELWIGLNVWIESFFVFILASIVGIVGLIVCLVKRKRMRKSVFITGISMCLLPAVVLVVYIFCQ